MLYSLALCADAGAASAECTSLSVKVSNNPRLQWPSLFLLPPHLMPPTRRSKHAQQATRSSLRSVFLHPRLSCASFSCRPVQDTCPLAEVTPLGALPVTRTIGSRIVIHIFGTVECGSHVGGKLEVRQHVFRRAFHGSTADRVWCAFQLGGNLDAPSPPLRHLKVGSPSFSLRATCPSDRDFMLSSITPSTVEGALTRPLTAAEKKRAQKLKDDPLVTLLSPLWVECRRCGSKIKLSPKSTYDPFHWARHRERCLKRPPKIVEAMRQDAEEQVCLAYFRCQTAGDLLTLSVTPAPSVLRVG